MNKKKTILIIIVILTFAITLTFLILNYKNSKNGNNTTSKSEEDIVNNILNIKNYSARLDITIVTNKNKTKYIVSQKIENGVATQEVEEPENIAGIKTEYDGTNLKISNNKLNLETTFQNYNYVVENRLWLDSFIEEYKTIQNTKKQIINNEIILEVRKNDSPYNVIKKLYIDKNNGMPTKMIVQDINQKTLVYILYTEITIS